MRGTMFIGLGAVKRPLRPDGPVLPWAWPVDNIRPILSRGGTMSWGQVPSGGQDWANMLAVGRLVDVVIQIYIWVLIASAIVSWLVAFDVVNRRNPVVSKIGLFLYRVTEPVLRPVRRV